MQLSSSKGLLIARFAASIARFEPEATAVPITAYPWPDIIVFTSAKSRLIMPGIVMMSEIPCTACRKISSAMRNASKKLVPCSTHSIKRSFGITMTVSTLPMSSPSACSACSIRRLPSKANGLVTTATVSAPNSLAKFATTGAAPLPVPPPSPAVTKTMSAPSSASRIFSVSSSAALRPTSGLAPAPSPFVNLAPSCSFTGACESLSACKSVLAAMNSTPSTLARIMRLTAFEPPPPTPITLIFAPLCVSSANETLNPDSFGVMLPPVFCLLRIYLSLSGPCKHAFQLSDPAVGPRPAASPSTGAIQNQSNSCCVLGPGNFFTHARKSARNRHAHGQVKDFFCEVAQAAQVRTASGEHQTRRNLILHAAAPQLVAHQHQQFLRARLGNVRQHTRIHGSRRAVAHACDFNRIVRSHQRAENARVLALDLLRFWNRRSQSNGEIVREVVPAYGNCRRVPHHSARKCDQLCRPAANIQQGRTQLAFVLRQARFRGSQRFQHRIVHAHTRAVHCRHDVLRRRARSRHDVYVRFETLADHPDRVANVIVRVEEKFLR